MRELLALTLVLNGGRARAADGAVVFFVEKTLVAMHDNVVRSENGAAPERDPCYPWCCQLDYSVFVSFRCCSSIEDLFSF